MELLRKDRVKSPPASSYLRISIIREGIEWIRGHKEDCHTRRVGEDRNRRLTAGVGGWEERNFKRL